ncbi:Ankyrin repeat-containing domain [Phytophthora cactorum]|nr:Ankyrin repeat-containing domain [Phytophthora cactorum]
MQPSPHDDAPDLWACARTPEAASPLARLLRDTVPPDDRNDFGETALHVAAAHGNDGAVTLLLRYGADLLAADWVLCTTSIYPVSVPSATDFAACVVLTDYSLSKASLLLLRHAQTRFGKKFLRNFLHEARDHSQQSPMQLLSTRLQHDHKPLEETCDGGLVYTFGKRDYQRASALCGDLAKVVALAPETSSSKYAEKKHSSSQSLTAILLFDGSRVEPTRLASLETTPMKKVAAGENHTMALSRTGQVFSWGSNSFGQLGHPGKSSSSQSRLTPKRVDAFRFHVVTDIAASGCHSAAIDADDGAVYTWGGNRRGQLGRKEGCGTDQADATPRSVDALRARHPLCVVYGDYDSVRAERLALSDWHTCVVLRCAHNGRSLGQVWQFGYGSYRPSRVNFPSAVSTSLAGAVMCDTWVPICKQRGMDIVEVSCAQNHSIALSASGSVFTWGHNVPALSHQPSSSSQDRHASLPVSGNKASPMPSPSAPQKVSLANYGPVASVCASQDHCAVVTQQGDLVTWGCGQQGVLGHGRGNTWQPSPKRVAGVKKAVAVAAGHQHTAVLVAPVHPDFNSVADIAAQDVVPSLVELVERKIAAHVDVTNCALVWQYAERYAALRLQNYCIEGESTRYIPAEVPEKPAKEKKTTKQSFATKSTSKNGSTPSETATRKTSSAAGDDLLAMTSLESVSGKSSVTPSKPNGRRKSRHSKFVPLTSFLTNKTAAAPTRGDASCPWSVSTTSAILEEEKPSVAQSKSAAAALPVFSPTPLAAHAFSEAFPLPGGPSLRKGSLVALLQDTVRQALEATRPQAQCSPFHHCRLDAEQKPRPKTLKEIQEEEEAAAAREREAKARLGGGVAPAQRSQSTEEQEFLEQQRQILADIERERAVKARATAAATSGGVAAANSQKPTEEDRKRSMPLRQQPQTKIKRASVPSRMLARPTTSSAVMALAKQARSTESLAKTTVIHSASAAPDSSSSVGAVAAVAAAAISTVEDSTNATAALATPQSPQLTDTVMAMTTAKEAVTSGISLEQATDRSDKPQPQESSWSAMLIALFAMIQPEWAKEKLELEEIPLEEIPITSQTQERDRSQCVLDSIDRPGRGTDTPVFFCGCYDGHGGEEAVDFVQKKLYGNIRAHLVENDEPVAHSIIMGFKDTEEEFKRRSQIKFEQGSWSSCSVGACAVMALVIEKKLYVATAAIAVPSWRIANPTEPSALNRLHLTIRQTRNENSDVCVDKKDEGTSEGPAEATPVGKRKPGTPAKDNTFVFRVRKDDEKDVGKQHAVDAAAVSAALRVKQEKAARAEMRRLVRQKKREEATREALNEEEMKHKKLSADQVSLYHMVQRQVKRELRKVRKEFLTSAARRDIMQLSETSVQAMKQELISFMAEHPPGNVALTLFVSACSLEEEEKKWQELKATLEVDRSPTSNDAASNSSNAVTETAATQQGSEVVAKDQQEILPCELKVTQSVETLQRSALQQLGSTTEQVCRTFKFTPAWTFN